MNNIEIIDGIIYTALDENVAITVTDNGANVTGGKVKIGTPDTNDTFTFDTGNGSLEFDGTTKKFTCAAGVTLYLQEDSDFKVVADEDFTFELKSDADKLSLVLDDANFSLTNDTRTVTTSIAGKMTFGNDGSLSLGNGTVVNLSWTDGTKLQLNSHGSTGSIGFGDAGIKITSDDENLDMIFTSPAMSTNISGIKGTIHYNAGVVSFDDNSKITATTTIGGQPILTTLETIGGTGHIDFNTTNGVIYAADTGALKVTWSRGDLESTFIVNSGSVQLGHNLFRITEGSDIATDLKNFVPAFYFTTSEAGTYTINGQTITTSAANLALTATDDYMTFKASRNVVEHNGMTFSGKGNVSLKPDIVVLGAGVKAAGFGENKSFMLAEAGNVTVDEKIFAATSLKNKLDEEIPLNVSVIGNADGFTFSRVITRESEDFFSQPDYSNVGKIFSEEFHSDDDSYRIHTDPIGLQEIIGITAPVTMNASAKFDGEPEETIFDLVTDSEGVFTIGETSYTIAGDSKVVIKAIYNTSMECARGFDGLNGTVSGDFTAHAVTINGGNPVWIFGDTDVSISAKGQRFEIFGLDDGASVSVSAAGKYNVNGTEISANAQDIIIGSADGAGLYINNTLSGTSINGSAGNDSIISSGDDVTIHAAGGDDTISLKGSAVIEYSAGDGNDLIRGFNSNSMLSISGGKYSASTVGSDMIISVGDDSITLSGTNSANIIGITDIPVERIARFINAKETISLANGNETVTLNDDGKNLAVVDNSGRKIIKLGDGGDAVVVYEDSITAGNSVSILGGAGSDTLIDLGDVPIIFDMSAGGKDEIAFEYANQNVTLKGYNPATGGGIATGNPDVTSMVDEILAGTDIRFVDGQIIMLSEAETKSVFTLAGKKNPHDAAIINFLDENERILPVGFTNSAGGTLDVSNSTDNYLLLGNYFGDKSGGSTLTAGSGNDTILAGAGDLVNAGDGKNQIYLTQHDLRQTSHGTRINLAGDGNNTVHNFKTGFDSDSDALYSEGGLGMRIRFDGNNVTASVSGSTQTTLAAVADDADFAKILLTDDEDVARKIAVAKPGGTIKSSDAEIFLGRENAAVDFSGTTENLLVNLSSDQPAVSSVKQKQFYGITRVAAGDGISTLIGSNANETLIAGNGYGSIWGGAGDDLLIGKADSSIKNGMTSFFLFAGDGNDTVTNFEFVTRDNRASGNADKIAVTADIVTRGSRSGDDVVLQLNGGDDYLTIEDAAGKDFLLNNFIVKVDKNISYDGFANCYVADGGSSVIAASLASAEIWLDGSHGELFFGDIRTLDATAVEGRNTLVGNALDDTILAGRGDSSLWGGSFGNDLLIGGQSRNTYFYFVGNGNDTIQNVHDGDVVMLADVSLGQIIGTEILADSVKINFADGGSLKVDGNSAVTYQLADGTKYKADHEQLTWQS